MKFIKLIAISRFNYIDAFVIALTANFGINGHYVYAVITVLVLSLLSAAAENYAKVN